MSPLLPIPPIFSSSEAKTRVLINAPLLSVNEPALILIEPLFPLASGESTLANLVIEFSVTPSSTTPSATLMLILPPLPNPNVLVLNLPPLINVSEFALTLIFPLLPIEFVLTRFWTLLSSVKVTAPVAFRVISPA